MPAAAASRPQQLPPPAHRAVVTMYAGLALTLLAIVIVPLVVALGTDQYADHIRHAYPDYSTDEVNHYQLIILIYLAVNGVIGALAWLWVIRQTRLHKPTVHLAAAALFAGGLTLALINMFTEDSTGYTALSTPLGLVGFLPSVAGLAVVALLWRARAARWPGRS
ncbi:hypothetical protein [Streptomyces sp. NPDC003401]